MEPFHRWARAAGFGVLVAEHLIPSVSFADDLTLLATSREEICSLVGAYLEWCQLLNITVTKVQLWRNKPGPHIIEVAGQRLESSPVFKVVGVVLAESDLVATPIHFQPRLAKALATTQRLRSLPLPAAICNFLWRTAVLPQALYGAELRDVRPAHLAPLTAAGRAVVADKDPLHLNLWRSPEALSSPSLGDSALRDPLLEARERQLRWLHLVCNLPGIVGQVHRFVAPMDGAWQDPTASLRHALLDVGWSLERNPLCLRAQEWPCVEPEVSYPGTVILEPVDSFPEVGAAFTDGSVSLRGGAAVFEADTETSLLSTVPEPRSSTQCELVALCLALSLSPPPRQVLTDSLTSLRLAQAWDSYSSARTLRCPDRIEVRQLVFLAHQLPFAPTLEKVKAHDEAAVAAGYPKALGNATADRLAHSAASESGHPVWSSASGPHGDPVLFRDSCGHLILDVRARLHDDWWEIRRRRSPSLV